MQEHPVPQNVTSFQFKLIGDMTLRQFGYVGAGMAIALIAFFAKTDILVINIFRYTLLVVCPLAGFALAFLPVEGRPLDRWLVAFMQAVFGNTLYIWKKEGVTYDVLDTMRTTTRRTPPQSLAPQGPTAVMPVQQAVDPLDANEMQSLANVAHMSQASPNQRPRPAMRQLQRAPLPANSLSRPMPAIKPQPRYVKSFAGPIGPARVIPSPMTAPVSQAALQATGMRLPHERPLVPKRIPLPTYQQPAVPKYYTRAPVLPTPTLHPLGMPQPTSYAIRSSSMMQPGMHAQPLEPHTLLPFSQTNVAPTRPVMSQPAIPTLQNAELQVLKKQNQQLFTQLQSLQNLVTTRLAKPNASNNTAFLADEAQNIGQRLASLDDTLGSIKEAVKTVSEEEAQYQQTIAALKNQMTELSSHKAINEEEFAKLQANNQSSLSALSESESKRKALEETLAHLQQQLSQAETLSSQIALQKESLKQTIDTLHHQESPTPAVVATQPVGFPSPAAVTTPAPPTPEPPKVAEIAPLPQPAPVIPAGELAQITTTPNAVSGYVLEASGQPLVDVVIVVKKAGGAPVRALKSNRVGQFSIVTPLADGTYEVSFEKEGYNFTTQTIEAKGAVIPPLRAEGKKTN